MAILNGPYASGMSGKVGEVVAAKTTGGRTALRSYNREIKNPNTLRQRVSRSKLAMASALAAIFSEVIKIGFAKAAAGTKMYARNMFVKDIVPVSSGVFTVSGETVSVVDTNLEFSKAVGINVKPSVGYEEGTGGETMDFTVSNSDMVTLPAGSALGLVVVLADQNMQASRVFMGTAAAGVKVPMSVLAELPSPMFWAFYKEIPEAFNGVTAAEIPWKYPSLTGPCTTKEVLG
jgi:hypothetical protein